MGRPHYQTAFLGIGLLFSCGALLAYPVEISKCVQQSLQLYAGTVFPALFPFFVLTSLVVDLGFSQWLGCFLSPVMTALFHLPGSCSSALVLGLLGGYPAGANATVTLYKSGQCTKTQAQCLLAFCNNCGPAFFLGIVGSSLFQSVQAGVFLYLVHSLSALLVGYILCRTQISVSPSTQTSNTVFQAVSFPVALTRAITNAFHSLLNICSFFLFFSIALKILTVSGLTTSIVHFLTTALPIQSQPLHALISGILELTTGITSLSGTHSLSCFLLSSLLLGWGGWSVHFQTLSLLSDTDLSGKLYLIGKGLHALVSVFLTAAILLPPFRLPFVVSLCSAALLLHRRKKAVENRSEIYYTIGN